jgi:hypothetical protein
MAPIVTSLASIVKQFGIGAIIASAPSGGGGITYTGASGGIISDYLDPTPGIRYRAHVFTSSGTFTVTDPAIASVEYLVVAGGGSGPSNNGGGAGGGGAGGYRSSVQGESSGGGGSAESVFPVSVSPYTVTVGAGAAPGFASVVGNQGSPSSFGPITSTGGGAGNCSNPPGGGPGGSGGGGGEFSDSRGNAGAGTANQGYPGGTGGGPSPANSGAGGGGAGAAGGNYVTANGSTAAREGGIGVQSNITGTATYYAGGGGASGNGLVGGNGGLGGGGGAGSGAPPGVAGSPNGYSSGAPGTGGGGGAKYQNPSAFAAGGGSGIVVVRYQLPASTGTAKATGGAISYYSGKTIHTFTSSGTFATAPNWTSATVEYVVIGGGGSGGLKQYLSGGGGAGAYRTGTTPIGAHPVSTTIQVGAGGVVSELGPAATPASADGTPSYFGTPITAPGGGGGGTYPSPGVGRAGGSGGGGAGISSPGGGGPASGAPFPGTIGATPTAGWGHAGGTGQQSSNYGGGGGGGAGNNGGNGGTTVGGNGGDGIQLPTTFRNPQSSIGAPGPTSAPTPNGFDVSGKFWVAGGGAGSMYPTGTPSAPGGGPGGPYAGGGAGGAGNNGGDGGTNTGGGGGGQEREPGPASQAGRGGSGIVLIAYPT